MAIEMGEAKAAVATFLGRPVCQKGTAPFSEGVRIDLVIESLSAISLLKGKEGLRIVDEPGSSPDVTFRLAESAFNKVKDEKSEEVAEMGLALLKLMIPGLSDQPIRVRLHIGLFEFVAKGYLAVLLQGGPAVMKFLAAHGLNGMHKIREAISQLKRD